MDKLGRLSFIKILKPSIRVNETLYSNKKEVKILKIFRIKVFEYKEISEAYYGDIVAVIFNVD